MKSNPISRAERSAMNAFKWVLIDKHVECYFFLSFFTFSRKKYVLYFLFGWLDNGILFFVFQKYKILNPDAHTRREQRALCEGGKEKYKYIRNGGWLGNIFMTLYGLGVVFWLFSWLLLDHLSKNCRPLLLFIMLRCYGSTSFSSPRL